MIILVTGGIKSGKSRRALDIAREEWNVSPEMPASFVATAEALDDEMKVRIRRHQEERMNRGFITIEEPLELDRAIAAALPRTVVDCLPLWVNNIMYYKREEDFSRLLEASINNMKECIVVTNETGLGNVPFNGITRRYNLLLAEANRTIAAAADRVELLISGISVRIK